LFIPLPYRRGYETLFIFGYILLQHPMTLFWASSVVNDNSTLNLNPYRHLKYDALCSDSNKLIWLIEHFPDQLVSLFHLAILESNAINIIQELTNRTRFQIVVNQYNLMSPKTSKLTSDVRNICNTVNTWWCTTWSELFFWSRSSVTTWSRVPLPPGQSSVTMHVTVLGGLNGYQLTLIYAVVFLFINRTYLGLYCSITNLDSILDEKSSVINLCF
jgi:hypothetical protein